MVGQHNGVEGPAGVATSLGGQAAVAANHKDTVTGLQEGVVRGRGEGRCGEGLWWCGEWCEGGVMRGGGVG